MNTNNWQRGNGITWITLFSTTGTLVCCAIPILLVSLGLGATVASLTSNLPFLVVLSENKIWLFTVSGILLVLSAWLLYRPGRHCPTDPILAAQCDRVFRWNKRIYWTSLVIWAIGFFTAFLLLPMTIWLDR